MENNVIILNFNDPDYSEVISDAIDSYCCVANGLIDYHTAYNEQERASAIRENYFNIEKLNNFIASNIIGHELIGGAFGFNIKDNALYEKYKMLARQLTSNISIVTNDEFQEMKKNMHSCCWAVIKFVKGKLMFHIY